MTNTHYHYTTVTEKRAPTDESVKILREMEREVLDLVVSRLSIKDNVFGEVVVLKEALEDAVIIAFKLNGKVYKAKVYRKDISMISMVDDTTVVAFYKKFTQAIADAIFENHYMEIMF